MRDVFCFFFISRSIFSTALNIFFFLSREILIAWHAIKYRYMSVQVQNDRQTQKRVNQISLLAVGNRRPNGSVLLHRCSHLLLLRGYWFVGFYSDWLWNDWDVGFLGWINEIINSKFLVIQLPCKVKMFFFMSNKKLFCFFHRPCRMLPSDWPKAALSLLVLNGSGYK